jgi:hypothetical protein
MGARSKAAEANLPVPAICGWLPPWSSAKIGAIPLGVRADGFLGDNDCSNRKTAADQCVAVAGLTRSMFMLAHGVKLRRTMLELSRENLGEALGLTFQQVQKYERGPIASARAVCIK